MSSSKSFATVRSAVVSGVRATVVTVEVSRGDGIPGETIVGLAGAAVRESLERIRAACRAAGLELEPRRTTVNLAPADHPKGGSGLDLPIALALLCADAKLPAECMVDVACIGELGLDGTVRPVSGTLPVALAAYEQGLQRLIVPAANVHEAAAISEIDVVGVASLDEVVAWARGELPPMPVPPRPAPSPTHDIDLDQIVGHTVPRRALEIAACGGHHVLLVGVPGTGKTLLARALAGILPELTQREALEASAVYSAVGQLTGRGLLERRTFRAPHHSVTAAGLLGGGVPPRPGEISLAHHGVLFLDELPEFRRSVLECLRQPLEESRLNIVRGGRAVALPCRFQLVAAMNPCPCGHGPASGECRCACFDVARYWHRLSGPLLDRIDLVVGVERAPLDDLIAGKPGHESSAKVCSRVTAARERQSARWRALRDAGDLPDGAPPFTNATLPTSLLNNVCALTKSQQRNARHEAERLRLSARGWHRVLRVARSLADLAGRETLFDVDLSEAFQYRQNSYDLTVPATRVTLN